MRFYKEGILYLYYRFIHSYFAGDFSMLFLLVHVNENFNVSLLHWEKSGDNYSGCPGKNSHSGKESNKISGSSFSLVFIAFFGGFGCCCVTSDAFSMMSHYHDPLRFLFCGIKNDLWFSWNLLLYFYWGFLMRYSENLSEFISFERNTSNI